MLNPIEEARHADLKNRCRELGVSPPPEIFIGLQVVDRNGVLIFDDKQRGHSWLRNYWNWAFWSTTLTPPTGSTYEAGSLATKAETGEIKNDDGCINATWRNAGMNADAGIVVGTSDTTFSAEHCAMGALIAHGAGAGQLAYCGQATPTASYTSDTKTWKSTLARIFNNNSSGSITVKETGLRINGGIFYAGYGYRFLLERSVLNPTATVPVGAQLTVTYEISMDFSAID